MVGQRSVCDFGSPVVHLVSRGGAAGYMMFSSNLLVRAAMSQYIEQKGFSIPALQILDADGFLSPPYKSRLVFGFVEGTKSPSKTHLVWPISLDLIFGREHPHRPRKVRCTLTMQPDIRLV